EEFRVQESYVNAVTINASAIPEVLAYDVLNCDVVGMVGWCGASYEEEFRIQSTRCIRLMRTVAVEGDSRDSQIVDREEIDHATRHARSELENGSGAIPG